MFLDKMAGVYDIFVNVINRKTHQKLKKIVSDLIGLMTRCWNAPAEQGFCQR